MRARNQQRAARAHAPTICRFGNVVPVSFLCSTTHTQHSRARIPIRVTPTHCTPAAAHQMASQADLLCAWFVQLAYVLLIVLPLFLLLLVCRPCTGADSANVVPLVVFAGHFTCPAAA